MRSDLFPFLIFVFFWQFNIITSINTFNERFESRLKQDQTFRSGSDPGQKNLVPSHPDSLRKKNFHRGPGPDTNPGQKKLQFGS